MHDIKILEEAFKKVQQMESDVNVSISMEKGRLEEKIETLHKTSRDLSLQKDNISSLIVDKKGIWKIRVDIKQSELYKLNIFVKSFEKSLNT